MKALMAAGVLGVLAAIGTGLNRADRAAEAAEAKPAAFAHIEDDGARAVAIFAEIGKVLTHPRCLNCHPSGDRPLQYEDSRPHEPKVARGPDGHGLPGMMCSTCHGPVNAPITDEWSMPGQAKWHLAPAEMAWEGKSIAQICEQVKDPARNGGMSLEEIVHHMGEDDLVGWGWNPGTGREPAPGTQAELGALARAWVDAGADCPSTATEPAGR